jgi:cytochrome d ubiquinol oxidase subunit II
MNGSAFAAAGLIWFVIFVYALAGSVDLGATFWRMVFAHRGEAEAEGVAARYVSPLWEAANVFLVLIAAGLNGFFPGASLAFGTVLLWPVGAVLVLLALRSSFLAFAHAAPHPPRFFWDVAGMTGLLLPALLVAILPVSQGGFVTGSGAHLSMPLGRLLGSPDTYAYMLFGVAACLSISATFLCDYARTAGSEPAFRCYRRQATWTAPLTVLAGSAALLLSPDPWLPGRLRPEWPWFLCSAVCLVLALAALWWKRGARSGVPRGAVVFTGLELALADVGYGIAHAPYLLYPQLATVAGFSNEAMFASLVWVVVIGLCVLVPGFVWLWRLFVLDPRYSRG